MGFPRLRIRTANAWVRQVLRRALWPVRISPWRKRRDGERPANEQEGLNRNSTQDERGRNWPPPSLHGALSHTKNHANIPSRPSQWQCGRSFLAPASRNVPSIEQRVILSPCDLRRSRSAQCSGLPRVVPSLGQQEHRRSDQQANRPMQSACRQ